MKDKGFSGSTLKIIAVMAMIMDHTAWCIFDPILVKSGVKIKTFLSPLLQIYISPVLCIISPLFHTIGRVTFPIMLFLLVEGIKYTKNKKKYLQNMIVFALLSEIPFNLAFGKKLFRSGKIIPYLEGQNVFVTLSLCLAALIIIDNVFKKEHLPKKIKYTAFSGCFIFCFFVSWYCIKRNLSALGYDISYIAVFSVFVILLSIVAILTIKLNEEKRIKIYLALLISACFAVLTYLFDSDYRFMGVIAVTVMYLLRENKTTAYLSGTAYLTVNSYLEAGAFLAAPLIASYNGKRGLRMKYFFYIAYPGHLIVLWLIRCIMKI